MVFEYSIRVVESFGEIISEGGVVLSFWKIISLGEFVVVDDGVRILKNVFSLFFSLLELFFGDMWEFVI